MLKFFTTSQFREATDPHLNSFRVVDERGEDDDAEDKEEN